jgi:mRNA interferase MazF
LIGSPPYQWSVFTIDLATARGSGRKRRRPVLVVSRESANAALPVVTVLPLISWRKGRHIYPNEVLLPSGSVGLNHDAIAMAHQTRTVAKERLQAPLGMIEDDELRTAVRRAMCVQLNLEPALCGRVNREVGGLG